MKKRIITSIVSALGVALLVYGGDAEARAGRKPGTAAHFKSLQTQVEIAGQPVCPIAVAESKEANHKPGTLAHFTKIQTQVGPVGLPVCERYETVESKEKSHKPGTIDIRTVVSTNEQPACAVAQAEWKNAVYRPGTLAHFNNLRTKAQTTDDAACEIVLSGSEKANEVCCLEN